jgi:hypothetical protein
MKEEELPLFNLPTNIDIPTCNRNEAYQSIRPELGRRQEQVLNVIKMHSPISKGDS